MLRLDPAVERRLRDRARSGRPAEVCGVLGGTYGPAVSVGEAARAVPNVAGRPRTRYRLDPEAQLQAMDDLREQGLEVVGFYHSHPEGPADPSPRDAAMATWENYSYVIVVREDDQWRVRSWRWRGDHFERESIE